VDLKELTELGADLLPGTIGVEFLESGEGSMRAQLEVERRHLGPAGYIHAAAVVALADSACGYGCFLNLPEGAYGFTTVELKTNFLATVDGGTISCEAKMMHGGRTTQVWDATVTGPDGKTLALFRCTQLVLRR
jgi:1,4-dihydroxy-2-naphthoyl-CoA hydrolase